MKLCVIVVVLAGCYSPSVRDCTVSCAQATDCTGGQVCERGWCTAATRCDDDGAAPDAAHVGDGPPDASRLCELGCSKGSCVAGVCVIDCSAPDSCTGSEITCEPNIPCRVVCGDRACDRKVICGLATTCEVVCAGTDACADEILCSTAPCAVTCSGEASCRKRIKCKEACACDVTCSGPSSCGETPECPLGDACRLGRGCAAALPGCNGCD